MNSSSIEVSTATQRILWKTEVYGLQHWIDKAVRAQITFAKFRDTIRERFAEARPESDVPADSVLQSLYERAVEAKTDRLWLAGVRQINRSNEWKAHRDWLDKVIKRTRELEKVLGKGDSRPMSDSDARMVRSVAQSTNGLLGRLLEIQKWDQHLSDWAKVKNRSSSLRQLRFASDRILERNCPRLNKIQRAELGALVIEAAALRTEEMPEAVARQLRRRRRVRVTSPSRSQRAG